MKRNVEDALSICGRDRVMQRDSGGRPAIAIRMDQDLPIPLPDGAMFLVREANSLDEAGELAASAFADRLRELGNGLLRQAQKIEVALRGGIRRV